MHEISLAQSVIDFVNKEKDKYPNSRIVKVKLKIGKLASVFPDTLTFAFQSLVENTPLSHVKLEILELEPKGYCKNCSNAYPLYDNVFQCPFCGSSNGDITEGTEFLIDSFEIEENVPT